MIYSSDFIHNAGGMLMIARGHDGGNPEFGRWRAHGSILQTIQPRVVVLYFFLGGVMEMLEGKPNFNDSLCMFIRPGLVWPSK